MQRNSSLSAAWVSRREIRAAMQLTGTLWGVNDSFTAPSPPLNCLPIDPVCHNIPYCKRCWNLDTGAWEEKHNVGAKEHLFAHVCVSLFVSMFKWIHFCVRVLNKNLQLNIRHVLRLQHVSENKPKTFLHENEETVVCWNRDSKTESQALAIEDQWIMDGFLGGQPLFLFN